MNTENSEQQAVGRYRPSLCFYHANQKGSGSAVKMNVHPAHDNAEGCIMMSIANQRTVGDRNAPTPTFSTFDWEGAIHVKLDFSDIVQILQVFRGVNESINEGRGLFHRSSKGATCIRLAHLVEPVSGYMLEISRKPNGEGGDLARSKIMFSQAEAFGLNTAITGVMSHICFGVPSLSGVAAAPRAGVA